MTQNPVDCSTNELVGRKLDLEEICDVFEPLKINCILIDGVLLGAVRDRDFIAWDWDVELALLEEEVIDNTTAILNALHLKGFEIISVNPFSFNYKINIRKRGTKFSLVGLRLSMGYRYRVNFKYPAHSFATLDEITFLGKQYKIPSNVESLLQFCYGDWQTPKRERLNSKYLNKKIYIPKILNWLIKLIIFLRKLPIDVAHNFFKIFCKIFPSYREYFFSVIMLKNALKKNATFIEIGSSDGSEMARALSYTKGNINAHLVEPSPENLEIARRRIAKTKYANSVSFSNSAISSINGLIAFFYNPQNRNLSSIREPKGKFVKRYVQSQTLEDFLLSKNIDQCSHLIVKMDIEGEEAKILKSSAEIFQKYESVSILMEVHPSEYDGDEMYSALTRLFDMGFKTSFVETAWVRAPRIIEESFGSPFKFFFNRGLYRDLPNELVARVASKPSMNVALFRPFFTTKIVRSIMIEKLND